MTISATCSAHPFDAVVFIEAIEHLDAPGVFLNTIRKVLKSDGLLVLTTPYHGYLQKLFVALAGRFNRHVDPLTDDEYVRSYSRRTLTELLAGNGFEVVSFDVSGLLPWLWKSMVITARKKD